MAANLLPYIHNNMPESHNPGVYYFDAYSRLLASFLSIVQWKKKSERH